MPLVVDSNYQTNLVYLSLESFRRFHTNRASSFPGSSNGYTYKDEPGVEVGGSHDPINQFFALKFFLHFLA